MPGPQPVSSADRRQRAAQIAAQFQAHYGSRLVAIGAYGSLARQSDGPYSDIEMFVVVQGQGIEHSFEWAETTWKAEVDVVSPDVLEAKAALVEGNWPLTHGAFTNVWPIYDPNSYFAGLRQVVESQPAAAFQNAMQGLIVGEIYEMVGKVRNAVYRANADPLAAYMVELAIYGALLVGLADRHIYRSFSSLFEDSLCLPDLPEGYQTLCGAAMCGDLRSPQLLLELCDAYWVGVEAWAQARGLAIFTRLDDLLSEDKP